MKEEGNRKNNKVRMIQYLVGKILIIKRTTNTIKEGLLLESECNLYLKENILIDITVVRDCMTALEQLKYSLYDLILIEQNIEYITGIEFIQILRRIEDYIPVILVIDPIDCNNIQKYIKEYDYFSILIQPLHPEIFVHEIVKIMNMNNDCQSREEEKKL